MFFLVIRFWVHRLCPFFNREEFLSTTCSTPVNKASSRHSEALSKTYIWATVDQRIAVWRLRRSWIQVRGDRQLPTLSIGSAGPACQIKRWYSTNCVHIWAEVIHQWNRCSLSTAGSPLGVIWCVWMVDTQPKIHSWTMFASNKLLL